MGTNRFHKAVHPVYPGLENAALPKAQYKLIHPGHNIYFRMYANNTTLRCVKGYMHFSPEQQPLTDNINTYHSRADTNQIINMHIKTYIQAGYIWEQKFETTEDVETAKYARAALFPDVELE